jgi:hypothetical protein
MGGKTWSRQEELLYWEELIPNSPKRLGKDLKSKKEKPWGWVARGMTEGMGADARRKYTPLCVCKSPLSCVVDTSPRRGRVSDHELTTHRSLVEHYFQNTYLGRMSPNIGKLATKYYRHGIYFHPPM